MLFAVASGRQKADSHDRQANQGPLVTSLGRKDLEAMLRVCGALRDNLKRVLLANLKSSEQGSP